MIKNTDSTTTFTKHHDYILKVCQSSLQYCTHTQSYCSFEDIIDNNEYPAHILLQHRASFITLTKQNELRGCIGSLQAYEPLLENLIHNTCSAALHDPRFEPVSNQELNDICIHVSILTKAETMNINSEQELLEQLTPGVDGLILSEGTRSATYLPSVWEQLPDKLSFVKQLKLKAGLAANYWSDEIECKNYQCESLSSCNL